MEKIDYSDFVFQILKLLSLDSRTPTFKIANKLNSTDKTFNNRIKN